MEPFSNHLHCCRHKKDIQDMASHFIIEEFLIPERFSKRYVRRALGKGGARDSPTKGLTSPIGGLRVLT